MQPYYMVGLTAEEPELFSLAAHPVGKLLLLQKWMSSSTGLSLSFTIPCYIKEPTDGMALTGVRR